jgi:chromosome segregation ATPase
MLPVTSIAFFILMSAQPVLGTEANPMRKIISMLQSMQAELEKEGEAEKEIFEKAFCACESGEKELTKEIEDATAEISTQESKLGSDSAEKDQLTAEVADHKSALAEAQSDLDKATSLREDDNKAFTKESASSAVNIKQLDSAIPALEKGLSSAAFVQTMKPKQLSHFRRTVETTKYMTGEMRTSVLAFLDQGTGEDAGQTVDAPGTSEIVGMLKQMKEDMSKDLAELKQQEGEDAETFTELKTAKTAEIDVNEKAIISKDKRIGTLKLSLSEATHALEDAQEALADAQKLAANLKEECASREKDLAMRQKMRSEEIVAISEAVKILNDDDALDTFKKALPSAALVQKEPGQKTYDAFIQTHSSRGRARLQTKGKSKHQSVLKHGQEPDVDYGKQAKGAFDKFVNVMVNNMVSVLHDEDVDDEVKKVWCDNETEVNEGIKSAKTAEAKKYESEIEEIDDKLATLAEEIKVLTANIQGLDKSVFEWTAQRKKEHDMFLNEFATSGTALRLIGKAMLRLEKFYSPKAYKAKTDAVKADALKSAGLSLLSKAPSKDDLAVKRWQEKLGGDLDFVQVRSSTRRVEQLPDTPGTYVKKESGGVIGLMQDFKTDLKMDMQEAEAEEKHAAEDYIRVMEDAKETRTADSKSLNQKAKVKAQLDVKLADDKEALALLEKELMNLELYLVKVHAECNFIMAHAEERHEGRVNEEVGLEGAKTIVTNEDPMTYKQVEERYDEEETKKDVDEHFPDAPVQMEE